MNSKQLGVRNQNLTLEFITPSDIETNSKINLIMPLLDSHSSLLIPMIDETKSKCTGYSVNFLNF